MRNPRRPPRAGPSGESRPILLALALLAAWLPGDAFARDVAISGSQMKRFGRILLQFDEPTKVDVKTSNSVLVITFASPTRIRTEKLAAELAPYISVARRDPDSTGLRLALATPLRANVLEAGERVYIDLLPKGWTGLDPALPPDVVADLARRAQAAEAKLKAEGQRPLPVGTLKLRVGELPSLTRIVLEPSAGPQPQVLNENGLVEVRFGRPLRLEGGDGKPKLAAGVALFETEAEPNGFVVRLKPAPGYSAHLFPEGDTLVLDVAKPSEKAAVEAAPPPLRSPAAPALPAPPPRAEPAIETRGARAEPPAAKEPAPSPPGASAARPPPIPAGPPGLVTPVVEAGPNGPSILFPFRTPTGAAAYERAGTLTVVFDTPDALDPAWTAQTQLKVDTSETRPDSLQVLRFRNDRPELARLTPAGTGWKLSFGHSGDELPSDALAVVRALDANGRGLVKVGVAGASKVHWLREPDGVRAAIVTARGRVQALPLSRQFVEFGLPATLHGVVVETRADDVVVALEQGGVTVTRDAGLTLSAGGRLRPDGSTGAALSDLVLAREAWTQDGSGQVLERYNALVSEAANAPRSGRAEARFRVARLLVANGMNEEASGILTVARAEDPVFARRRETSLLSGVAAVRSGRTRAARTFLSPETVGDDAEAILWRALADAQDRRWKEALAGFRKSPEVVELYADDLAGRIRLSILTAAVEMGDLGSAERELTAIDRLASGSIPRHEHDFARARVDEVAGRTAAAVEGYAGLIEEADHKVASEAMERWVAMSLKAGAIDRNEAIRRLEALSVTWRGGDVEIKTLNELAHLYGEAERWRDMFAMTRRASRYFPEHPLTRALHDQSAALLEQLLLGAGAAKLMPVQALALYFDFKELAPIGRRGDEIVRRLADRLVELDLLDQASELLQYQVDNRLSGLARATVAARLATIRLMDGKPLLALSALQSTRLAEMPAEARRFRFMLEARAQSDLGRSNLALETLEGESGPDFDRLRAGILWTGKRWREAGEAGEALVGTRWSGPEPLDERERREVLRAVIAYTLADERVSLDRIRQKFAGKMMDSPDAKTFELLIRPGAIQTKEFRAAAQEAARDDSLRSLLSDWRIREETSETGPGAPAG